MYGRTSHIAIDEEDMLLDALRDADREVRGNK
ncbi:hypothetical protein DESC_120202 [Desulfosarcina cetonica]|nr:hypothetical protein DESC_120202 [Desulfosarcina cetonica]